MPSVGFSLRALPTTASWVPAVRCISSTPAAWKTVEVEVPSMGESITEGTVATILAQPGTLEGGMVSWGRLSSFTLAWSWILFSG